MHGTECAPEKEPLRCSGCRGKDQVIEYPAFLSNQSRPSHHGQVIRGWEKSTNIEASGNFALASRRGKGERNPNSTAIERETGADRYQTKRPQMIDSADARNEKRGPK